MKRDPTSTKTEEQAEREFLKAAPDNSQEPPSGAESGNRLSGILKAHESRRSQTAGRQRAGGPGHAGAVLLGFLSGILLMALLIIRGRAKRTRKKRRFGHLKSDI